MVKSFRSWESLALKLNHRMFCGRTLWWSGDTFLIYHLTSPVWRNGWQRITLCHHALPTFFGKRSCGGGNRTFLVCLVTSCDHVIWDHITLWMEELFTHVTTVPSCHHCAFRSMEVELLLSTFLLSHVTKRSRKYAVGKREPLILCHHFVKFNAYTLCFL